MRGGSAVVAHAYVVVNMEMPSRKCLRRDVPERDGRAPLFATRGGGREIDVPSRRGDGADRGAITQRPVHVVRTPASFAGERKGGVDHGCVRWKRGILHNHRVP
ncbi:MAG: hypothetical protein JNG89_07460 [Planctomycetaceae bacterium]|nr:hypothetical protein [Planctomycetaceae bacterium]